MPLFYMHGMPIGGTAIMLALIASIGGFIFGYDTGQISDLLLMDDFKLRFATCTNYSIANTCQFSVIRAGLIVSLLSIGTLAGALMGAPIADGIGRRYAMVSECLIFCIGIIVQLTSAHVWQQIAVGRLISGLAIGALSAAVPMYQAETAPQQIRGTLTATYQLFITLGILVAYCIAIGTRYLSGAKSWRVVIGIGLVWPCILAFGMLFMPESPRWLAAHGRRAEAERAIARSYGIKAADEHSNQFVQTEVDEIMNQVQMESRYKSGWIDCFRPGHKTLYRTLLGMSLQSLQQLTGANYFFYYGATIFQSVGIDDSFVTQIILGAVNFICTFGGLYVMERFGRRIPLIVGGIWQSAWLFVFAAAGTAKDPVGNKGIGKLMIVSACMFILGYAMTWAPGVWILIGETFPTRTRAKQGALSTASNWLWNFLIAFFTPFITSAIHFRYGFVFAACNLAGAVVVFFFLYESSDLSLEGVDDMYNDPSCKPWTSRSWAPAGYSSRYDVAERKKATQARKGSLSGAGAEKDGPLGNANANGAVGGIGGGIGNAYGNGYPQNGVPGAGVGSTAAAAGVGAVGGAMAGAMAGHQNGFAPGSGGHGQFNEDGKQFPIGDGTVGDGGFAPGFGGFATGGQMPMPEPQHGSVPDARILPPSAEGVGPGGFVVPGTTGYAYGAPGSEIGGFPGDGGTNVEPGVHAAGMTRVMSANDGVRGMDGEPDDHALRHTKTTGDIGMPGSETPGSKSRSMKGSTAILGLTMDDLGKPV